MPQFIKPNVVLPISLHDARVTQCIADDSSITFTLVDGFFLIHEGNVSRTERSELHFTKVDFSFSSVCLYNGETRKQIGFDEFAKLLEQASFDIVDETYGYNKTMLQGMLAANSGFDECSVEIYHFDEIKYVWN